MTARRPTPPDGLFEPGGRFVPAPDLELWARATFIEPRGSLTNPDHAHLTEATIGFVWTNVENICGQRSVSGTAEQFNPKGTKWAVARHESLILAWFHGEVPDFIVTLYAPYAVAASDLAFCALVEHELYHCGQAVDEFGGPKFRKDGTPVFQVVGHEVEEFVAVVRRYGAGVAAGATQALVDAAALAPEIGHADAEWACGTCRARAL